ncbi:MAG: hypothetical protein WCC37_10130, partial [Candidatus Sulfotelmatobacter sp.]
MTVEQLKVDVSEYPVAVKAPAQAQDAISGVSLCAICHGLCQISARRLFDTRFGIEGTVEARRCRGCGWEQIFPSPTPA